MQKVKKACTHASKFCLRGVIVAALVVVLFVGGLFAWTVSGPKSLYFLKDAVQEELNSISPYLRVTLDNIFIKWDNEANNIVLSATNIHITNPDKLPLATLPEIYFEISLLRFITGDFVSPDITLLDPTFELYTTTLINPSTEASATETSIAPLHEYLYTESLSTYINHVHIRRGNLNIHNGREDLVWKMNHGNMRLINKNNYFKISIDLELNVAAKHPTYWSLSVTPVENKQFDISWQASDLTTSMINDLIPTLIPENNIITLNGTLDTRITDKLNVKHIHFNIREAHGSIELSDILPRTIMFDKLGAYGSYYLNRHELILKNASFRLDQQATFTLNGHVEDIFIENETPHLSATLMIDQLPTKVLNHYWPEFFRPRLRSWITKRITNGVISHAEGQLVISKDDMKLLKEQAKLAKTNKAALQDLPLPSPNMLDATITLKGATINYQDRYPKAENVDATVNFNHKSMIATLNKATIGSSNIKPGSTVTIENMWVIPSVIIIDAQLTGSSADAAKFIEASLKHHNKNPRLNTLYNLTGNATTHAKIKFPLLKKLALEQVDIDIKATLNNTTFPKALHDIDVTHANLDVTVNNKEVTASGTALLDSTPFNIDYTQSIAAPPDNAYHNQFIINTTVSTDELRNLKLVDIPYITGPMKVQATIRESKDHMLIKGQADIVDSTINIDSYSLHKPAAIDGLITFNVINQPNKTTIKQFKLSSSELNASGNIIIATAKDQAPTVTKLRLDPLTYKRQNFTLDYEKGKKNTSFVLKGSTADLSNISFSELFGQSNPDTPRGLSLSIKLGTLFMKNKINIHQLSANVNCSPEQCDDINLYGKFDQDKFIVASLKPSGNNRTLMIESDNAGNIIKALGFSKHIEGGRLNVHTTAHRNKDGLLTTKGTIYIKNFKAIKTPMLSKILTLASLKGFLDLLNQEGISFESFEAPITIEKGIITIKDAKSKGSSIGITGNGTINTNADGWVDIKGVIVPAQELNKLIGKIPVIGDIIKGGKDEGIIATNYHIKGSLESPETSVNPLSMITPGFLRKIFGIFD